MIKKFIVLFTLIPNLLFAMQCNFPIYWPLDGSIITKQEWDQQIREAKSYFRTSGMTNSQFTQMIREELKNYKPGNYGYDSMVDEANNLCREVGPIEYDSILKCIEKLTIKASKDIGLNLPNNLIKTSFDMIPACTSNMTNNSSNSESKSFEDFCKKSTLEDLDKDVAMLCLEKIN